MSFTRYLEGYWTPAVALVGGAGNVVPVYLSYSGTWTRVGRLLFFNGHLKGNGGAGGAGTGQIHIVVPFVCSPDQLRVRLPMGTLLNGPEEYEVFGELSPGAVSIPLFAPRQTGTHQELFPLLGANQNNATREICIQTKLLIVR